MHAEQCVNVGAVREGTWPQSILDQDPLTGHHPPPMGDTLPINNWICQNNLQWKKLFS